jgi:ABC-type transport system involved in multi-copper enzyme maturation permease subunit
MIATVHAEWTKLRTLRANAWLVLAIVGLTVATSVASTASVDVSSCPSPSACFEDTTKLSLGGVRLGQVAVVVLAVQAVGDEYGTGMIRTTLAATPRRHAVLLGKAAVVAAVVAAAGTLAVLGSLAAGRAILPGNGFTAANGYEALSLADGPTARASAGTVLYLVLVALLALGVAAALRDTPAALTAVLALLFVVPVLTSVVGDPHWQDRLQKVAPMPAGLAIQATTALERLPIGPWPGLAVLGGYAGASLLAGGLLLGARDA